MIPLRVMIVDDEPLAREHLAGLLSGEADMTLVGEAGGGSEALRLIAELKPDLVFLDVHMPGLNGFDVLRSLPAALRPLVVFVTAYDQHAVDAFEISAVDYLLKPVLEERFRTAARRAAERANAPKQHDVLTRLASVLDRFPPAATDRIPIPVDGRVLFVTPREIDWVEARDDHVKVHAGKNAHLVRETMSHIESRLPTGFVRIHRSTLVNAERIREIQPWVKGDFIVILSDGTRLTSGRTYRDRVRALLS
jgi:two-component system, LytTR family, response regulator